MQRYEHKRGYSSSQGVPRGRDHKEHTRVRVFTKNEMNSLKHIMFENPAIRFDDIEWHPLHSPDDFFILVKRLVEDGFVGLIKIDGMRPKYRAFNAVPSLGEWASLQACIVEQALEFYNLVDK